MLYIARFRTSRCTVAYLIEEKQFSQTRSLYNISLIIIMQDTVDNALLDMLI